MSETPNTLKRSVGAPFWCGCLVGPILFLLATLGIINDSFTFWFFICIAVVVFGPLGGAIFQVIHDLSVARRLRLFHVWDYAVFAAIGVALFVAGFALFQAWNKNSDNDPFKNKTLDIAAVSLLLIVLTYAVSKNWVHFSLRQTWVAILLTIGLLAGCAVISSLIGFNIFSIMVLGTSLWAAIDSSKIQLKRYKSGISYGPVVLFFCFAFLWVIAFPWYLIVRNNIRTGTAVLKDGAENVAA